VQGACGRVLAWSGPGHDDGSGPGHDDGSGLATTMGWGLAVTMVVARP